MIASRRQPGWRSQGGIRLILMLLLALLPHASLAAWTQATGTSGIRFISMSKIGTTLYAGALAGGLYQSTDDGASWSTAFGTTFDTWTPYVVTQIGSILYVGGAKSGAAHLAYSTDAGSTWTDLTAWGAATYIRDVKLLNGATFVAARGSGVYRSTSNDGTGWTLSNTGMTTQSSPAKFAQIGTDIFVADASNNGTDGVFKSSDNGLTWTRVSAGLPSTGSAVSGLLNYNGALLFAMGSSVWRSLDSGASWTQVYSGSSYDLVINNATLYLSGTPGISLYTSTNGTAWTSQPVVGITASYLQPGIVISGGKLVLSSGDGIWRETDPAPTYALTITAPSNGSVASNTGGIACGSTCSAYYASGDSVTLTATANGGYTFSNWGGDCSGSTNPLTLTVSANMACTASYVVANTAPSFVGGTTSLTVAESSGATNVGGLLHVSDVDASQTLTWSQSAAPSHGTLTISGASAASGSADVAPGGTLTYTPTPGYVGSDSFTVQVSDGTASASRSISVTVDPAPAVSGIPTQVAGVTATVTASGCSSVDSAVFLTAPPGLPTASFPYGLLDFTLSGCSATVTVTITYSQNLPAGATYYKFMSGLYAAYPATISGATVSFTLTDNDAAADSDPTAGVIHDPSGVGWPGGAEPIPSLSAWGRILLAGLLALFGLWRFQGRGGVPQ